jgi:hypothetical protein
VTFTRDVLRDGLIAVKRYLLREAQAKTQKLIRWRPRRPR